MAALGETGVQAIRRAAAARSELLTRLRRDLHRMPEPGHAERETTRYIAEFLAARGIPHEICSTGTGVLAVIGGGEAKVLLRADIDGLPVEEETGLPFRSGNPGWMHACGHDAHTAILLAAADALAGGAVPSAPGAVLFFQPAEEGPGGCRPALDAGLLTKHPVRRAFALHVWPELPAGTAGLSAGPVMAGMDYVRCRFLGRGGHGAYPHLCVDPVLMAAEGLSALRTVVSRNLDPLESGVLTFGVLRGGQAPNVIPDAVEAEGTLRWFSEPARAEMRSAAGRILRGVAEAHGGRCEVEFREGYPPTVNDPEAVGELLPALAWVLGEGAVLPQRRTMGAEDMSFLLREVPGCYLQLGAGPSDEPLHSPRFAPDERCLRHGLEAMLAAVSAFSS